MPFSLLDSFERQSFGRMISFARLAESAKLGSKLLLHSGFTRIQRAVGGVL
jgi:hypothetical protein